jgi:hypothetical protein
MKNKTFKQSKLKKALHNKEQDTLWTTPWTWRDEEDMYIGRNNEVWLYRALPSDPMLWEDPSTRLALGQKLASLMVEIGETSAVPFGGMKRFANNREIHLISITWERPTIPPEENSLALRQLQTDMLTSDAPKRVLIVGVRLRNNAPGQSVSTSMLEQTKSIITRVLLEDVPDREVYMRDKEVIGAMCARAGARIMTAEERGQLESWYNKGRGPETTIIEEVNSLKIPAFDTFEMSTVMRFNTMFHAPDAHWIMEAAGHPFGPSVISVRAELEPATVIRNRARKSQRKVEKTMREEAATRDLERPEYAQSFQMAQEFETYRMNTNEAWLTKCSILMARKVRPADETFVDHLRYNYGIDIKTLEHRQIRALDEMLPCSSRRINPFLQEVSIDMIAYAGMNGFSSLGDKKGLYSAMAHPDCTPVYIDPSAAARENKPAAMLIAGDSGSGKSFLCQMLAIQAAVDGQTVIFINPKGHDSLSPMSDLVNGTVIKMSALEKEPGAFDPFRYAPPKVAAEIATNHILTVLGGRGGFTQTQSLELGAAFKQAAAVNATCVGEALGFLTDISMRTQIEQLVDGSSLFALGIALHPLPKFDNRSGLTLIEFDSKLDLPDSNVKPENYSRPQNIALAALRLVTRASLEILEISGGGVLIVDEAWTFLSYSEGLAALTQLGREGRSLRILPIFATQRVADLLDADMESFLSRVFCLKLRDPNDAAKALKLCGLAPTTERIAWLATCGPQEATADSEMRPAVGLHRDIHDRHSAVMIWPVPEFMRRVISTNARDRDNLNEQENS